MVIVWGRVMTGHLAGTAGVNVREVRRFVREALSSEDGTSRVTRGSAGRWRGVPWLVRGRNEHRPARRRRRAGRGLGGGAGFGEGAEGC
ncbi:hypothetical protein GCM10022214_68530 [Actinomadura miaoliensis]|uniref:Uncharacterized protein n=1 Tax=Actinomadura miaoliensis TaxID=430685 RepID=A0ABP7WSB0_9ACTN